MRIIKWSRVGDYVVVVVVVKLGGGGGGGGGGAVNSDGSTWGSDG